jgi:hypothetical protein
MFVWRKRKMTTKHYEPLQILPNVPMISEEFLLYGASKLGARFLNAIIRDEKYVAVDMHDRGERNQSGKLELNKELTDLLANATSMPFPEITLYTKDDHQVTVSAWTQPTRAGTIEGYLSVRDVDAILKGLPFNLYSTKEIKD